MKIIESENLQSAPNPKQTGAIGHKEYPVPRYVDYGTLSPNFFLHFAL